MENQEKDSIVKIEADMEAAILEFCQKLNNLTARTFNVQEKAENVEARFAVKEYRGRIINFNAKMMSIKPSLIPDAEVS